MGICSSDYTPSCLSQCFSLFLFCLCFSSFSGATSFPPAAVRLFLPCKSSHQLTSFLEDLILSSSFPFSPFLADQGSLQRSGRNWHFSGHPLVGLKVWVRLFSSQLRGSMVSMVLAGDGAPSLLELTVCLGGGGGGWAGSVPQP